jgi:hypothetical protein
MHLNVLSSLFALGGDALWLLADAIVEPILHLPRWPFFPAIGLCFLIAVVLLILELRD